MSFMVEGIHVSVVRDDSSEISLLSVSFLNSYALARSREGVFRALVTLVEGDVRFSTEFPFALRDVLPVTVVLGHDCHPEVRLPSWHNGMVDGEYSGNKAAQDMVCQEIVHELPTVLLDQDGSVTMAKEITAAYALDMSVGHVSGSSGGGGQACTAIARGFSEVSSLVDYMLGIVLSLCAKKLTKPLLRHVLDIINVQAVSVNARRDTMLKNYISRLENGKQCEDDDVNRDLAYRRREVIKDEARRNWPQKIGEDIKAHIWMCCDVLTAELMTREVVVIHGSWILSVVLLLCLIKSRCLKTFFSMDEWGFNRQPNGDIGLSFCQSCFASVKKKRLPTTAIANHHYLGPVPDKLKDLSVIEEAMIACCCAKCWVIHLKEENSNLHLPHSQCGMKGHIIIYPQNPSAIAQVLPPSLDEVVTPICVLFVGSSPPTQEWLQTKASPLITRREHVRRALEWLSQHN
ncbi:hypothetical protein DFH29DRAFT_871302 [Suillus ampliporus]|nr:hypothetical protein DFH29DRAFT_871302 [Suillus ampliporus]